MPLPVVTGEFRAAADPNLRFAPSGVAVCNVRAVASSRKKQGDEWVDDKSCWVNLTGFKKVAENMAESIEKGDLITVTGKISTDDWENKDGEKRTSINIVVDTIGVSMAFNPVKSVRSERSSGGNNGGGGGSGSTTKQEDPWGADPWASSGQSEEPPF